MRRTSILILASLLALPASDALAKNKGRGHGKGHAKHAHQGHDRDEVRVRERAVHRNHADRARRVRVARQGLDRNGDGIITRAEWRGNARSFDVQDRNNDGVISAHDRSSARNRYGANARYGAWRTLDRNTDGVLERWEWPHSSDLFSDIDRNHDGLVSQWELRSSAR